ncbi:hypothetical protein [Pedobacter sp. L105]|uniref:hypothetical protein n=1 Tax=Pedobacter sp. L105 TaxID=1641871 RepID=UPI00131BA8B3|nr:hypothetical protein [Pedobacter sp. L105]
MKFIFNTTLAMVILLTFPTSSFSQDTSFRTDKFYTMSGFGFSVPVGGSSEFMTPKFSTTLGANIGIGHEGLFLYPHVSLHAFGYDNRIINEKYNFELQNGRSTSYLLSLALGYRKIIHKFGFYGFLGSGAGFILTPRVAVDAASGVAVLNNRTNHMATIEPGAGIEYNLGGISLFTESSYMHGLSDVGGKPFDAVPITIGIKPNLSKLFNKKKTNL